MVDKVGFLITTTPGDWQDYIDAFTNVWVKKLGHSKETLINAAMRSFAAQGNVFSCQSRQLTTAGGSGWPWCRQADASVLRARYRFASANSENTWAPFLAMPR